MTVRAGFERIYSRLTGSDPITEPSEALMLVADRERALHDLRNAEARKDTRSIRICREALRIATHAALKVGA